MSSDAYDKDNPKSEYLLYLHGYQQGGSKFGLFMAASEYWAQICSEYFTNPEGFLKNHPNDFKLVDTYVKKNDPSFDIFSKDRGAFDSNTGQIRDIYK
jgi:hypothetical protein